MKKVDELISIIAELEEQERQRGDGSTEKKANAARKELNELLDQSPYYWHNNINFINLT